MTWLRGSLPRPLGCVGTRVGSPPNAIVVVTALAAWALA